jgi:hypothetical protein
MTKQTPLPDLSPSLIIDELGGNKPVAELCCKRDGTPITEAAVSTWRKTGIPDGWLRYLWEKRRFKLNQLARIRA